MSSAWSGSPPLSGWRHAVHFALGCSSPEPVASITMLSRLASNNSRKSNSALLRSSGRTNSQSRQDGLSATLRSKPRSNAGFICTITPCEVQRATDIGTCSNTARKAVFEFSLGESSDHGIETAVFIVLLLWLGRLPEESPRWAIRYLGVPDLGAAIANPTINPISISL